MCPLKMLVQNTIDSLRGLVLQTITITGVLTRLVVEELGLGPPNWFGGVGLLSPPEKEKPIYYPIPYYFTI